MLAYFFIILLYLFSFSLVFSVIPNLTLALTFKSLSVAAALFYFRKKLPLKLSWNNTAIIAGLIVGVVWIAVDPLYPHIGESVTYTFGIFDIMLRVIISIILAPIVEEFFTRFFLLRYIIDKEWKKVPLGTFTWPSFIATVLFFGLSHNRWLAGLFAGIVYNLVFYREKEMNSVVLSHAVSNLVIAVFVLYTGNYTLW